MTSLAKFEKHIEAFLRPKEHRALQSWQRERVLFAPEFGEAERAALSQRGYICKALYDYSKLV